MTLLESVKQTHQGETNLAAITSTFLKKIEEDKTNSFHEVWDDEATSRAESISTTLPLSGAVIAIKDNIVTKNGTTTCGTASQKNKSNN